jgi:hypothetical protein
MKPFISDRGVFCDLIHHKLVEKPFKNEVGNQIFYMIYKHQNPMMNNNLNLPKGFMNSMNSKAIAI